MLMVNHLVGFGAFQAVGGTGVNEDSPAADGTIDFGANSYTFGCRTFTLDNGSTVFRMSMTNNTGARTLNFKILLDAGGGTYDVTAVITGASHTGGGKEYFNLSSPFAVPGSGTYYMAVHCASWGNIQKYSGLNLEYLTGQASGNGVAFASQNRETPVMGVEY